MLGPLDRILAGAKVVAAAPEATRGQRAASIAERVRTTLNLADEVAVTVQQLTCREPGCPPVETVIAVLGTRPRRWTIHRPLVEIDDATVTDLLAHDPMETT